MTLLLSIRFGFRIHRSDCDLLSAFAPACGKNLPAALGAHSGSESMYFCALPFLGLKCHFCHLYILLNRNSCEMIRALPCRVRFRQKVTYHSSLYPAPGNNVTAAPALPEGADTVAGSGIIRGFTALYMTVQRGFIASPVKTLTSKLYIIPFLSSRKIFYPYFPQSIHNKM